MSGRPINIHPSDWGTFDPNSPSDQMCERERVAFTQYTLKRLQKRAKTGSDNSAIFIGGIMAIVQIVYAIHGNTPTEAHRESLHQVLDFAWLQCAAISLEPGDVQ